MVISLLQNQSTRQEQSPYLQSMTDPITPPFLQLVKLVRNIPNVFTMVFVFICFLVKICLTITAI